MFFFVLPNKGMHHGFDLFLGLFSFFLRSRMVIILRKPQNCVPHSAASKLKVSCYFRWVSGDTLFRLWFNRREKEITTLAAFGAQGETLAVMCFLRRVEHILFVRHGL